MNELVVNGPPKSLVVRGIEESEQVKMAMAASMSTGLTIASREDMEQAGDSLRILKRGLSAVETMLREAFRPLKEIERLTRDSYRARYSDPMEAAAKRLDAAMRQWDRAEQQRAREEQIRAQREAEAAAAAARQAQESGAFADDEDVLAPAEVPIERPEAVVRGAVSTTSKVRRVEAVALVDPQAAAAEWGAEVVALNARIAVERYAAKMKLGLLDFPPDEVDGVAGGVVVGGVRFVTRTSFSSHGRGA